MPCYGLGYLGRFAGAISCTAPQEARTLTPTVCSGSADWEPMQLCSHAHVVHSTSSIRYHHVQYILYRYDIDTYDIDAIACTQRTVLN